MEKLKPLLPKALYILGELVILLAPIRFLASLSIAARGHMLSVSEWEWLNYAAAAISTCGSGLLYMAAARVVELLEKRDDDEL